MVSADNGTGHVDYAYDAIGRRVSRDDGTDLTNFTFDGQDVLMDDDSVSGISTYQNGLGIDAKLKVSGPTSSSYFLADHLGSTNGLTDSTGSLIAPTSYDSFGNASGSFPSRYQFTGREYDSAIGLQYSRARWYDPSIGRFISEDPIGFGGGDINLFGYVWNNPQNFYDPSGLDGWGNDFADWADKQIENARRYYQPDVSDWWTNGVNNTVADVSHDVANWFRVGNGLGHALYCEDNIYGKAAYIAMDVERAAGIAGTVLSITSPRFSSTPSWAARAPASNEPVFPDNPVAMDNTLGFKGTRVPDGPNTPGRNKVVWSPSDEVKITFEQHPYHTNAPTWHQGPHWHVDTPGASHVRYLPGDRFPGW